MSDSHSIITDEIWKPIPGFPGYDVSNHGQVRSYWKQISHKFIFEISDTPQRFLKQNYHNSIYLKVSLRRDEKSNSCLVHQLVLLAFVGPCPVGLECCHNDGSKLNNYISNLRYGTRQDNVNDRSIHNTNLCGTKHPLSKLTDNKVRTIRKLYSKGVSQKDLAKKYKMSSASIHRIVFNKRWTHVLP